MRSILAITLLVFVSVSLSYGQSWEQSVKDLLQSHHSENNFEGVVLMAVDNQPVMTWSCGIANRDSGRTLDINSRFALGELTHYLTALEVLILVDEDRLSLSDTLSGLLPQLSLPLGKNVTVENLLTHTSGYPEELEESYAMRNSPRIIVERSLEDKSKIKPPGTFRKSNLNYLLLGMIVKETAAQSWKDALEEDIINKFSLDSTGFLKWNEYPDNWAHGHMKSDSTGWRPVELKHIENYHSAGSVYSSAKDLLKIDKAIQSGKIPDPLEVLQYDVTNSYPEKSYAGFRAFRYPWAIDNPVVIERSSNFGGYQLLWISIPSTNSSIVILSNLPNFESSTFGNLTNLKEQLILKMASCGDFHIEPCEGQ